MNDCIKRDASYWTKCRCDTCRPRQARRRKIYYVKGSVRVPNDVAWERLARFIEDDWSARAIGSATGLGPDYFSRHLAEYARGRRVYLGPVAAERVLNAGHPTEGQVGAEPTRRRLRALARIGWGLDSLSSETGVKFSTLAMVRNRNQRVSARIANAVRETYDRLHMTPGNDDQARREATAKGWLSPLAWDDIDTDEAPHAQRYRPVRVRNGAELLNEFEHLVGLGVSAERAASQLGVTVSAIERAYARRSKREGAA